MKHYSFLAVVVAGCLMNPCWAGTMGTAPVNDWTWVGSLSLGAAWTHAGETQQFYLTPDIEKAYIADKPSSTLGLGQLFVGVQKVLSQQWLGQLGLELATAGRTKLQGIIWDDANPIFNNHSYGYKIWNTRLAIKGKLLLDKGYALMPWISGSIGVGFNRSYDFNNTPLIFEAIRNSNYANNTKTSFAYALGAGVQRAVSEHWQVGLGYEFAGWGKNQLGNALGQVLNSGLRLNHLYTNGVLLNLTYIA